MKANAAMTRNVVCIEADDSLIDAHQIMTEWEIRHLPVLSDRKLVGILSDRDVLIHASQGENGLEVPDRPVEDVMTPNPITCRATSDVSTIGETMIEHKIDCLPVVDEDGEIIGLVTSTDLIELLISKEPPSARRTLPFRYQVYMSARPGMAGGAV